jgi:hypothetical protein
MEPDRSNRRREPRFQIAAGSTVEVSKNGQLAHATTVDLSGCGVRLRFEEPIQLALGDHVLCEFKIPQDAGELLPYWGVGDVVRVEDHCVAIDFSGAGWSSLESEDGSAPR